MRLVRRLFFVACCGPLIALAVTPLFVGGPGSIGWLWFLISWAILAVVLTSVLLGVTAFMIDTAAWLEEADRQVDKTLSEAARPDDPDRPLSADETFRRLRTEAERHHRGLPH